MMTVQLFGQKNAQSSHLTLDRIPFDKYSIVKRYSKTLDRFDVKDFDRNDITIFIHFTVYYAIKLILQQNVTIVQHYFALIYPSIKL